MPNDELDRAVREAAELMGLRSDRISPADRLRCELIAALRRVIDDQLAQVTSANSSDLSKLVTAVETLTRFLAEARPNAESPDEFEDDPHANLMRIIENWVEGDKAERAELAAERAAAGLSAPMADLAAAQARIDLLEAEVARLRSADPKLLATPASAPNAEPERTIRLVIDAEANPPATPTAAEREANRVRINNDRSAYTQQGLRQRPYVDDSGGGFFFGGDRGRAW